MLGKGLESLIPQKGNQNSAGNPALPTGVGQGAANLNPADELPPGRDLEISRLRDFEPARTSPNPQPITLASVPEMRPQSQPQPKAQLQSQPIQPQQKSQPPARKEDVIQQSVFQIEVEKIEPNPDQPRRTFDEAALRDLAHSIREFGFLQPLVVTKVKKETPDGIGVEYQLIAGERRFMAAKLLGLRVVPAIVRNVGLEREKLELAVIENIQRENLNPVETARAFQRLQEEFRMTQREIAAKLGKSRETVANTVRLLDLPEYIQQALQKGDLSESHARLLLGVEDPGVQKRLFDEVIQQRLTTRDMKDRVKQLSGPRPYHHADQHLTPEVQAMQETLSQSLGAPVEIHKGVTTSKITITFYSQEELENILRKLGEKRSDNQTNL